MLIRPQILDTAKLSPAKLERQRLFLFFKFGAQLKCPLQTSTFHPHGPASEAHDGSEYRKKHTSEQILLVNNTKRLGPAGPILQFHTKAVAGKFQ